MTSQPKTVVRLFDKYSILVPPKHKWHQDGVAGSRCLFIADSKETFNVSFEEGMQMMDMVADNENGVPTVSYHCCKEGKYIHLKRNKNGKITCAFFHIELTDKYGNVLCLPGQIVASADYKWSEGIEPVLLNLLEGISIVG